MPNVQSVYVGGHDVEKDSKTFTTEFGERLFKHFNCVANITVLYCLHVALFHILFCPSKTLACSSICILNQILIRYYINI